MSYIEQVMAQVDSLACAGSSQACQMERFLFGNGGGFVEEIANKFRHFIIGENEREF